MDPNWQDYWSKSRDQGQMLFVLKRGTALGLIMFGLLVLIPRLFHMVDKTGLPVVGFIVFMLLGYALACALWWANERSFKKLGQKSHNESEDENARK